jgi:CHAT domain-containing protein
LRVHFKWWRKRLIWSVALLALLAPLSCHLTQRFEAEFTRASLLFQHGRLADSQELSARLGRKLQTADPQLAVKFRILEAESAVWRGSYEEALGILATQPPLDSAPEITIQKHILIGWAYSHMHRFGEAESELSKAEQLCSVTEFPTCGGLLRTRGGLAIQRGQPGDAYHLYLQSLVFARKFNQRMDEATAMMNLANACLLEERISEAIDWSLAARQRASDIDAEDVLVVVLGNLGWAYYKLGDTEKALGIYVEALGRATDIGDIGEAALLLTISGIAYQDINDFPHAQESYIKALNLAKQTNSKEDIIDALEDLAHVSVQAGKFDDASHYIDQLTPLLRVSNNRLDALDIMLAQGEIAAARREDAKAEEFFRTVEHDPDSQTSMRLGAEHQLARLYEAQGHTKDAQSMYKTALATFEGARDQLKDEESKLPFLANATSIYDDYIHFLVTQGKTDEALMTADQSRARTLAQGFGVATKQASLHPAYSSPQAVARKAGATLLFYWLGAQQSYLWAVTPEKTALFTLPAQREITPLVERYGKAVLGVGDPLESGSANNRTGQELYKMLVAPASKLIPPNTSVMILADGVLSLLNFETILVPGLLPGQKSHYWIEDATLISAPSLAMLAAAKPERGISRDSAGKLLLLGDAVSAGEDYPELLFASTEMKQIEKHFSTGNEVVFARRQATPEAYLASKPAQFSYIHFVSHGIASRMDPLDSAIILSGTASSTTTAENDSFKLYAREIMRHPIDARLVTISACYGSGTRAYAGEGLVGLSWAFLHAGAHNVVGALWEASDSSSPRLMDTLYQGLEDGQSPATALRQAKLILLHSQSNFRKPFYWAPFQIYTGM